MDEDILECTWNLIISVSIGLSLDKLSNFIFHIFIPLSNFKSHFELIFISLIAEALNVMRI